MPVNNTITVAVTSSGLMAKRSVLELRNALALKGVSMTVKAIGRDSQEFEALAKTHKVRLMWANVADLDSGPGYTPQNPAPVFAPKKAPKKAVKTVKAVEVTPDLSSPALNHTYKGRLSTEQRKGMEFLLNLGVSEATIKRTVDRKLLAQFA